MQITETAKKVLEKRYYVNNESTYGDLCKRVSNFFGKTKEEKEAFYNLMFDGYFLPNSPALMNADTNINSFSACFVLPIEDNIESIYKFYSDAAKISKSGGGVGCNYSKLRAKNSTVNSTNGVASGPLSFAEVQDKSTDIIKQGGRRRGANMMVLNCDHPDILEFIDYKNDKTKLNNFNLSVNITDEFMSKIDGGEEKQIWDRICERAWECGEPGVLFGDTAERFNVVKHLGKLESTNPCGEQWLLNYESCSLGSINLGKVINDDEIIDFDKLEEIVNKAVLFMNRILDKTIMPISECQEALNKTRKIGIGIMGLHDLLIKFGLPYDSEDARNVAKNIMDFISDKAHGASFKLGQKEGIYEGYIPGCPIRRNANLTTIAPTGTLSMIADCSSGIEPYYSVITIKNVLDGENLVLINKWFEKSLRKIKSEEETKEIIEKIKKAGNINIPEVPKQIKKLFKGANDISPKDHVLMQAALQKYVDSSISKTINMPSSATVEDVKEVYLLAYKNGCKGITIYRDGSRDGQVLTTSKTPKNSVFSRPDNINFTFAPKRPKSLPAEIHHCSIKGTPWVVIVGLLNEKPYEVFAGELNDLYIPKTCKNGTITKTKSGTYSLTIKIRNSEVEFKEIANTLMTAEQKALTRMISLSLRHGVHYEFIVNQLKKASGDITDFASVVNRVLRSYISQYVYAKEKKCKECGNKIIFVEGCEKCSVCGFSKCG